MFIALIALAPARAAADACTVTAVELPVTIDGTRAISTVEINGTEVRLVVDTGAFFSFLTYAAAAQLKLPVSAGPIDLQVSGFAGAIETGVTTVKQLKLLKGEIPDVEFVVGGNDTGHGALGLLGRNLLEFTDTEYDLANGVIRFMFPKGDCSGRNMAYWAGSAPVSELVLRHDRTSRLPAILANAKLDGVDVRVMFDTGATSIVSLEAARKAGLTEADMTPDTAMYGAGRGKVAAWTAPIERFELAGEVVNHTRLSVADFDTEDADMLLGIDFFLSHRIYVSAKQRHMFFTYNGGPVFARPAAFAQAGASAAASHADADQPEDASALARRGAASAARHDLAGALADLDRACAMAPQQADLFAQRARVHAALQQSSQAQADLDTALRLDPALAEPRLERAQRRVEAGDATGAMDDLQMLEKVVAPQGEARYDMALLYSRLGRPDRAVTQWTSWIDAHRTDGSLAGALNGRCWASALAGIDLDRALADCDAVVRANPAQANYLGSRGWVHLRRGEWREALADFDRSLALQPDGPFALYGRGLLQGKPGIASQGRADIEQARRLRPQIDAEMGRYGLGAEDAPTSSAAASTPPPDAMPAAPAPGAAASATSVD